MQLAHKIPQAYRAAFLQKTADIATRIGVTADELLAIMDFESAGTFSPTKQNNAGNNYFGLIQFGADAAKDLGTTLAKLKAMTAIEQLDYVEKWFMLWRKRKGAITNFADLYLTVLLPKGIGYGLTDPLPFTKKQIAANRGLADANGKITKASILAKYASRYPWITQNKTEVIEAVQSLPPNYVSTQSIDELPQVMADMEQSQDSEANTIIIGATALLLVIALS